MISFLEMVQQYPIGAKVNVRKDKSGDEKEDQQEIVGYEYYNGTGYLVFRNAEKINVEQINHSRKEQPPKFF